MGMVPKQKNNSKNPPKLNSMGSGVGTVLVAKDPSLLVCWAHCWGGTEELISRVLYPDCMVYIYCTFFANFLRQKALCTHRLF